MRNLPSLSAALALLGSCAAIETPSAESSSNGASPHPTYRLSLLAGRRSLEDDGLTDDIGLDNLQEPPAAGIEFSTSPADWPVGFETGLQGAIEEDDPQPGVEVEGRLLEVYAGLRKDFHVGKMLVPYLGAGVSVIMTEVEVDSTTSGSFDDDDTSPGIYAHGGLLFDISRAFHLGFDVRTLQGTDVEVLDLDGDVDYWQFAVVLGFGF